MVCKISSKNEGIFQQNVFHSTLNSDRRCFLLNYSRQKIKEPVYYFFLHWVTLFQAAEKPEYKNIIQIAEGGKRLKIQSARKIMIKT